MIQDHVTSLELSKQLVEAGIVVESEFYWVYRGKDDENRDVWESYTGREVGNEGFIDFPRYPAPLSSELGELLPDGYHTWKGLDESLPEGDKWWCVKFSEPEFDSSYEEFISADTEANAHAKCLLYLKTKGLL